MTHHVLARQPDEIPQPGCSRRKHLEHPGSRHPNQSADMTNESTRMRPTDAASTALGVQRARRSTIAELIGVGACCTVLSTAMRG